MTPHTLQSKITTKDLGNGSYEHTFHPISDVQYQFLSEGVEQYYEGESCFEAVHKAIQAGVNALSTSYQPGYVVVDTGLGVWNTESQHLSVGQLVTFESSGSFMAVDPSSDNAIGMVVGTPDSQGWVNVEYSGIITKANCGYHNYCPALNRIIEQYCHEDRNKRFMGVGKNINLSLRWDVVSQIVKYIKRFNDPLTTEQAIQQHWDKIIFFGQFDFPFSLPNGLEIYL